METVKLLTVHKLPDEDCIYTNLLYHNVEDFESKQVYLSIPVPNLVEGKRKVATYTSAKHTAIPKGHIGVGKIVRAQFNLKLGIQYDFGVSEILTRRYAQNLRLKIDVRPKTKRDLKEVVKPPLKEESNESNAVKEATNSTLDDFYVIHQETFDTLFKKYFNIIYLNPNQYLIMPYNDQDLIIKVLWGSGYLSETTQLQLTSNDVSVNIINENQMSRDFFKPDFSFESIGIGGLDQELGNILRRAMSTRAISSEFIDRLGIKHVKGLILYGPPGTGKTLIARNLGKLLSKVPPTVINGPELLNKFVGQSEENLRNLFKVAKESLEKEGDKSPLYIYIFDEIDAICKQRGSSASGSSVGDSMVNQLLTLIDGVHQLSNIFIIGMTNRLDLIDEALIRPGRLEIKVRISLPDEKGREQIFRIHTDKMRNNNLVDTLNIPLLVEKTNNYSGAEIEAVVKNASSYAIGEFLRAGEYRSEKEIIVKPKHFMEAVNDIVPAFGNKESISFKNLPELTAPNRAVCDDLLRLIRKSDIHPNMKSILLSMGPKRGKTSIMKHLCLDLGKIGYIKMIQPIDIMKKTETGKLEYLTTILEQAYESEKSLLIIDDIDIMLDFFNVSGQFHFSNRLFQVLKTILKNKPNNTFYFVCTTSCKELLPVIDRDFDEVLRCEPSSLTFEDLTTE